MQKRRQLQLRDIPLEGPASQTITPPRRRGAGVLLAAVLVIVVVGVVALTLWASGDLVSARAFVRP